MKTHVEKMDEVQRELRELLKAAQVLTGGLNDPEKTYYLKRIGYWLDYARSSTGFRIDGRAYLVDNIPCAGGWKGEELNLAADKEGIIQDMDVNEYGELSLCFVPDNQVWVPDMTYEKQGIFKGVPKPVDRPHAFWLKARHLRPMEDKCTTTTT